MPKRILIFFFFFFRWAFLYVWKTFFCWPCLQQYFALPPCLDFCLASSTSYNQTSNTGFKSWYGMSSQIYNHGFLWYVLVSIKCCQTYTVFSQLLYNSQCLRTFAFFGLGFVETKTCWYSPKDLYISVLFNRKSKTDNECTVQPDILLSKETN